MKYVFESLDAMAAHLRAHAAKARRRALATTDMRKREIELSEAYGYEQSAYIIESSSIIAKG